MPSLYMAGTIVVFLLGIGYIAYRNIRENVKLKKEIEDAKRYGEAMQKAAKVKSAVKRMPKSTTVKRMQERTRNR